MQQFFGIHLRLNRTIIYLYTAYTCFLVRHFSIKPLGTTYTNLGQSLMMRTLYKQITFFMLKPIGVFFFCLERHKMARHTPPNVSVRHNVKKKITFRFMMVR